MAPKAASLVDAQVFRDAMAQLVAPLAIVTTVDAEGHHRGFTASSVISVSLDPPLLLVSVSRESSCHAAITSAPEFVVNVLGSGHQEVATRFATTGVDRFAGAGFSHWPGTGLLCLPEAHALFRCVRAEVVPVGDHDLVVGGLTGVRLDQADGDVAPLVWYQRGFHIPH